MITRDTDGASRGSTEPERGTEAGEQTPLTIGARLEVEQMRREFGTGEPCAVSVGNDGRYLLERQLGYGGMGDVYLARDVVLRRLVALKVIATRLGHSRSLRIRLLREARALARVRHPNVLEVYDIDTADSGELFLTMTYVPGLTLGDWQRGRGQRAVLASYVEAGRGLDAAHRAGIVHRDFKPGNVLVDEQTAHVYVGDFGLASRPRPVEAVAHARAEARTTGAAGTLAYMAPELFAGSEASFASDQFSFCVAVWEAVTGELPFDAESLDRRPPPRSSVMRPWLHRVLSRGLASDPAARFPTMATLTRALERGLSSRRYVVATLVSGLAAGLAGLLWAAQSEPPSCTSVAEAIDAIWTEDARARIERALGDDGEGERAASYALEVLDQSASAWRRASVSSCETHRAAPLSHRAMSQRACLDGRLAHFADTLESLEQLGPGAGERIHELLEPLSSPGARCELPRPTLAEYATDRLEAAELAHARREYELALVEAAKILETDVGEPCVEGRTYRVERGEALMRIAQARGALIQPEHGLEALAEAAAHANACSHDELLARILVLRAQILALDLERPDAALAALRSAEAIHARLGGLGVGAVEFYKAHGFTALARDDPRAAVAWYEKALAALGNELGLEPQRAKLHGNIGAALQQLGEYDEAERRYRRAVDLVAAALGPRHPETRARRAQAAFNIGLMASERGDEARAIEVLGELEALDELGAVIELRTALLQSLAQDPDRFEDAVRDAHGLLEIVESAEDSPPRTLAQAWTVAGQVLGLADDPRGLTSLERALELWEELPNTDHNRDSCQLAYIDALAASDRAGEARHQLRSLYSRFDAATVEVIRDEAAKLAVRLGLDVGLACD